MTAAVRRDIPLRRAGCDHRPGFAVALGLVLLAGLAAPTAAFAHAGEGGFVLLLPTDVYVAGGTLVVALTVALLALAPAWNPDRLLRPVATLPTLPGTIRTLTQFLGLAVLLILLWAGATGPTDPLRNPLTLGLWTVFWIGLVTVQALVLDLWAWVNPFAALARLTAALFRPPLADRRPSPWIAVVLFLAFAGFLLADPAPADPRRLALIATAYTAVTFAAIALFGPRWLVRGEFLTVMLRTYRRTALACTGRLGLTGWRLLRPRAPSLAAATLILILLGSGSFDGLNETFRWLELLGLNPLEFPGRSVIVGPTLAGLLAVNAGLIAAYGLAIRAGLTLAGGGMSFAHALRAFAPTILPIAAAYHVAHYMTSALVDGQHVLSALSYVLGQGERHVTTGFLNSLGTVRILWLTQAGAVVLGHVVAILAAHGLALRYFETPRQATLSQLPLALFMIAYTIFGLWLLAAPKGA